MEENNQQQVTPAAVEPVAAQPVAEQPVAEQPVAEQPVTAQPVAPAPQPAVPVQQVYSPVPPVAPVEGGKKKKGKGAVIALVIVLAAAVLGVAGFFLFKGLGSNPEAKLKKGFANLQKEMEAYGNPLASEIDFKTIGEMMAAGASDTNLSLNLTAQGMEEMLGTVGVDVSIKQDFPNKLLDTNLAFSIANVPVVDGSVFVEGNKLYIDIPSLLPDAYFVNMDTFGADYNASPWAWMIGYEIDEELSFDLYADADVQEEADALVKETEEFFEEQAAALKEAMTIKKADDKVEITRADGKTVSCSGVSVVIEKDAVNDFMEAYMDMFMETAYMQQLIAMQAEAYAGYMDADEIADMFAEQFKTMFACFKNDLELCVYLDGKGRIVSVTTPEKIKFKDSVLTSIDVNLEFTGAERALDEVNGTITFATPYGDLKAKISRTAEATKENTTDEIKVKLINPDDENMEFVYSNNWNLEEKEFVEEFSMSVDGETLLLEVEGKYTDIKKGESFTIELGKADLSFDGERLFGLFGTVSVAPLSEDIQMPSDAKDLLGLSIEEFSALGYSISEALNALMGY